MSENQIYQIFQCGEWASHVLFRESFQDAKSFSKQLLFNARAPDVQLLYAGQLASVTQQVFIHEYQNDFGSE